MSALVRAEHKETVNNNSCKRTLTQTLIKIEITVDKYS